jgi:hypothetical protein
LSTKSNVLVTRCSNWKYIGDILRRHDESKEHKKRMCVYVKRSKSVGGIDSEMIKEHEKQTNYWREVLKRVVATAKLLATFGLGFREHDRSSKGNFISCLECLAEFDIFFKTHLEAYSKCGKGPVNYLSNTTCDELIGLMATNVRNTIINDIKQAKYFSLITDSTPDVSHADQLSFIIKYIDKQNQMQARFLSFIHITKHDASYLENITS